MKPGIHALRQEVPIILPDDQRVTSSINDLTMVFSKRDRRLEKVAQAKLSTRFAQLNGTIESSVREAILDSSHNLLRLVPGHTRDCAKSVHSRTLPSSMRPHIR